MSLDNEQEIPEPSVKSWPRILAYSIVLAILALMGWGLYRVYAGPLSEGPAPDFTLETFDGEPITLSDLRGQVVVINFWASWCPPCRDEAPYLESSWRKYRDHGVVLLGVDYVDTEAEARAYIAEFDITYPNGPDLGTRISQAYRIQGVPETFFVGKDGTIRGVKIGPLVPPELDEKITELLAEPYP
ncbi:MAG: TlpA disulfide reductase family protein [Anaerolineales bacterium]|nr:TlpA disulfide reductase family protein [Anaerolineales bacterium]